MDFGSLKDGAAGCGEPPEAAGHVEAADRAREFFATGDGTEGMQVSPEFLQIQRAA